MLNLWDWDKISSSSFFVSHAACTIVETEDVIKVVPLLKLNKQYLFKKIVYEYVFHMYVISLQCYSLL